MTIHDLLTAISCGDYDDNTNVLYDALNARTRFLQMKKAISLRAMLKPGDICTLRDIKPKYLVGMKVRVIEVNTGTNYIRCEYLSTRRNRRIGAITGIPPSCLILSLAVSNNDV